MAFDQKYGHVTCEKGNLLPDEPVFIFRASDLLAMPALQAYEELCKAAKRPPEFLAAMKDAIDVFAEWRGSKKLPD